MRGQVYAQICGISYILIWQMHHDQIDNIQNGQRLPTLIMHMACFQTATINPLGSTGVQWHIGPGNNSSVLAMWFNLQSLSCDLLVSKLIHREESISHFMSSFSFRYTLFMYNCPRTPLLFRHLLVFLIWLPDYDSYRLHGVSILALMEHSWSLLFHASVFCGCT